MLCKVVYLLMYSASWVYTGQSPCSSRNTLQVRLLLSRQPQSSHLILIHPLQRRFNTSTQFRLSFSIWAKGSYFLGTDFPHGSASGHSPYLHGAPAFSNNTGATFLHSSSILFANSRISHWARLQHLSRKKWSSSLAFIVITSWVVQAFGSMVSGIFFGYSII